MRAHRLIKHPAWLGTAGLALLVGSAVSAQQRPVTTGTTRTTVRYTQTTRPGQPPPPSRPREDPGQYYEMHGEEDPANPTYGVVGKLSRAAGTPEYHTVKQGDTLWGLCESYFRNPWLWPKVWSYNPSITNPHWIYPGNRIRLRKAGEVSAPKVVLRAYAKKLARPKTIYLKQRGFIAEEELKHQAKIVGSREEKILLATFDQVYVKYPKKKPLKVGERYMIYKEIRALKHPHHKRLIGKMVEVFGELEIKKLSKANVAMGVILKAVNPVERGFLVGKLKRTFKTVKPVANTQTQVTGAVVAVLDENHLIGTKQLVFLDRGRKYRVKVGYTFYVTRRGDAYRAMSQFKQKRRPQERKWPKELVAEIVVVDVGWNHSVGYVAKTLKEIRLGDRVELLVQGRAKSPK